VSHGHVDVNGRRANTPSIRVRKGDVVTLRDRSRNVITIQWNMDTLDRSVVPWLERGENNFSVTVRELPLREHIDTPVREQLIVELYSK
jgi:small subunit ribosomal protein S4